MKQYTTLNLLITCVVVFSGTAPIWAEQSRGMMRHHEQSETMMPSAPKQSEMMEQETESIRTLPAMLEQMAETLRQGDVSPEMQRQMADQMQETARRMQGMPGLMDGGDIMPPPMPMMELNVMLDRMHELQNQTHHMMGAWERMIQQPGMNTAYGNSMMNMSRNLNAMARMMNQFMNTMHALMDNQALMQEQEHDHSRRNFEQIHTDLNGMMWNYERMVQQMRELQQQE